MMRMHQRGRDSVDMVGNSSTPPALSITIPEPWPERRGGVCNYPVVSFFCRAVRRQTLHVIPPSVCSILGPKAPPQCTMTIKSTGTPLPTPTSTITPSSPTPTTCIVLSGGPAMQGPESSDSDDTPSSTASTAFTRAVTTSSSGSELSNTADSSTSSLDPASSDINPVTSTLDSSASTSSPSSSMLGQATPDIPSAAPTYTSSSNSASLQKTGAVSKSNIGAIAGGVIGGLLFLVLVFFLTFKAVKRRRRFQALSTEHPYEHDDFNDESALREMSQNPAFATQYHTPNSTTLLRVDSEPRRYSIATSDSVSSSEAYSLRPDAWEERREEALARVYMLVKALNTNVQIPKDILHA